MTQEDKELLLKDLCARLPYGVKCYEADVEYTFDIIGTTSNNKEFVFSDGYERNLEQIKPYLRPLSSMTEEEKEQLAIIKSEDFQLVRQWVKNESFKETGAPCPVTCGEIDYCNKKHFDYRGLIEKGLALEAPEGMYN